MRCVHIRRRKHWQLILFPPTTVRILLAHLRDAFSAPRTQASSIILRASLRQLLQVGGTDSLLCDIRNLRTAPVYRRNAWCICGPGQGTHSPVCSLESGRSFSTHASNSVQTHNMNGPWPVGATLPETLPVATTVTILQLAHTCALLGIINFFVLTATRGIRSPALQEKIASSLFTPLLVSDVTHILVTLYGIGDTRWKVDEWPSIIWITVITGLTLLVPRFVRENRHVSGLKHLSNSIRVFWKLGIGRYVDSRDAWLNEKN